MCKNRVNFNGFMCYNGIVKVDSYTALLFGERLRVNLGLLLYKEG